MLSETQIWQISCWTQSLNTKSEITARHINLTWDVDLPQPKTKLVRNIHLTEIKSKSYRTHNLIKLMNPYCRKHKSDKNPSKQSDPLKKQPNTKPIELMISLNSWTHIFENRNSEKQSKLAEHMASAPKTKFVRNIHLTETKSKNP